MAKIRKYEFVDGVTTETPPTASSPTDPSDVITLGYFNTIFQGAILAIADGATSKVVTLGTAYSTAESYTISISIRNTADASPIFLEPYISAKAAGSFTVSFVAATDSENYILEYSTRKV